NIGTIPGDTYAVCAAIGGAGALRNTLVGSGRDGVPPTGVGNIDFRLRQRQSTTIRLPGYAGGATDTAAVVAFIQGNNNLGGTPTGLTSVSSPPGGGFTGGSPATCP
ncbi:MAG: hypothetical protein H7Y43_10165, partial [Akkermansiaceae bacterium]|nr:hypothetical protein [Verrucomicrobiales bacterium]